MPEIKSKTLNPTLKPTPLLKQDVFAVIFRITPLFCLTYYVDLGKIPNYSDVKREDQTLPP